MFEDLHFGYEKNGFQCSCGRHFGCGNFTPELRAALAARMRDKMPSLMPDVMKQFLADFERWHGTVHYTMGETGTNSGYFIKSNKSGAINVPIYNHNYDMATNKTA